MIAGVSGGPAAVTSPTPRTRTPLQVFSARFSPKGHPDGLDVTREGIGGKPDPLGVLFAPSNRILRPALRAREIADDMRRDADDLTKAPTGIERVALLARAEQIEAAAWDIYEPAFMAEMRESYRANRRAWEGLLARSSIVLCCFCVLRPGAPPRCHRVLLRSRIFPALGAVDRGEIGASS